VFGQGDGLLAEPGFFGGFLRHRPDPRKTTAHVDAGLALDPYWPFHTLHGRATCFRPGQRSTVFTNAPAGLLFLEIPVATQPVESRRIYIPSNRELASHIAWIRKETPQFEAVMVCIRCSFRCKASCRLRNSPLYRTILRMAPPSISNPWGAFREETRSRRVSPPTTCREPSNVAFPLSRSVSLTLTLNCSNSAVESDLRAPVQRKHGCASLLRGNQRHALEFRARDKCCCVHPGQCGGSPCSTTQIRCRRPFQGSSRC